MGDSPKWVKSKRRRKKIIGEKEERLNDGDNNGQATHGARKHAWRTQAAWAKIGLFDIELSTRDPNSRVWKKYPLPANLPKIELDLQNSLNMVSSPPPGRPGRSEMLAEAVQAVNTHSTVIEAAVKALAEKSGSVDKSRKNTEKSISPPPSLVRPDFGGVVSSCSTGGTPSTGVNILHQRGELFPDEFAPKHLTLPYLLTKFWKMGNFSPMEYRGIIQNIHPCQGPDQREDHPSEWESRPCSANRETIQ